MSTSPTTTSKLIKLAPEGGPREVNGKPMGQLYEFVFADGTKGLFSGLITGPSKDGKLITVGKDYQYHTVTHPGGKIQVVIDAFVPEASSPGATVQQLATKISGVTTADKTPIAPKEPPASPGQSAVPPSMRQPTRTYEEVIASTPKAAVENLKEGKAIAVPPSIPDEKPRPGTVKAVVRSGDPFMVGQVTWYKHTVTMEDGTVANMWNTEEKAPVEVGQTVTYTLSPLNFKGQRYADGGKRMEIVPDGGTANREELIIRQSCLKAGVEIVASMELDKMTSEDRADIAIKVALKFEKHILR